MMKRWILGLLVLLVVSGAMEGAVIHKGQSEGMKFKVEKIFEGLEIPWGLDFLPEGKKVFVTERKGELSIIDFKAKTKKPVKGLPKILVGGQGGLLDVKLHPKYGAGKPWVYITYSEESPKGAVTVLARFKVKNFKVVEFKKLLVTKSATSTSRHFGSRVVFDEKDFLYFTVGDRGERPNGQNLKTHAGSVIRLKDDGSVPKDNPFFKKNKEALPEIWSYGHRNPQGLVYDFLNKRLWLIEHGPRGGDEINLVEPGKNYGWPVISYGKEYWGPMDVGEGTHKKGMEQPVHHYVPSIAPSGLEVYSGKAFPKWKGNLFSGALKLTHLNRIVLNETKFKKEERLLEELNMRVRFVKEDELGHLYLGTDDGLILRVVPN